MPEFTTDFELMLHLRDGIVEAERALKNGDTAGATQLLSELVPDVTVSASETQA